ncbi:MAG: tRNA (adenosine(37)-N6)-threonylcarbamoyltransferase complex ATPase subunit type 1 TsaE [Burkholderiaceae bacterium]
MAELSAFSETALSWLTEDDTRQTATTLAAALSATAPTSLFITLQGDLGAGKTTFVRHLLQAMGVTGRIKSPTYAVVESYDMINDTFNLWHFDFYRFNDPHEWEEAGFRDIFAGPGYKLAEWPQKAGGLLPEPDIAILIVANTNESRTVTLRTHTPAGEQVVQSLKMIQNA